MSDKRPSLASDNNQPRLREPKPPFGLTRKRWNRIQLRIIIAAAVFASLFVLWLITQRDQQPEAHRIQGDRLAPYYEVASEVVGCDSPVPQEPDGTFIGVHQGFPPGPVLVECHHPQECETVTQRNPELARPAMFRGELADVNWADWAGPPGILLDENGAWVGDQRHRWERDGECHVVERREELSLDEGRLTQTVEILHGSRQCGEEPTPHCVFRRVRELRAPRRQ